MTIAQSATRPETRAEWAEFFNEERIPQLTKLQQRHLRLIEDADEADALELYSEVFDELPKSKKKQKKEKTPEQIEEELTAEQEALFAKLTAHKKKLAEKVPKDSDGNIKKWDCEELFSKLSPTKRKFAETTLKSIRIYSAAIEVQKLLFKKSTYTEYKEQQNYIENPENQRECGLTGETLKCIYGANRKEGAAVIEYKVVECIEATQKHGVKLEEGEKVLFNQSTKEQKQIKVKDCRRATPIDKIVGCECAINYDFAKQIYKPNEEGVYEKVKKDWGCIPCNAKVVDGLKVCARHKKSEKAQEVWEREMLKVADDKIV
jgi:hypothetical protein